MENRGWDLHPCFEECICPWELHQFHHKHSYSRNQRFWEYQDDILECKVQLLSVFKERDVELWVQLFLCAVSHKIWHDSWGKSSMCILRVNILKGRWKLLLVPSWSHQALGRAHCWFKPPSDTTSSSIDIQTNERACCLPLPSSAVIHEIPVIEF